MTTPQNETLDLAEKNQLLVQDLSNYVNELFLKHGLILRSIFVSLDYHGNFNEDERYAKGLWVSGDGGQVKNPVEVLATLQRVSLLLGEVYERLRSINQGTDELILSKYRELHAIQKEIQNNVRNQEEMAASVSAAANLT